MADMKSGLKSVWKKGLAAINQTAKNIEGNTRYKMNEMTLVARRREILSDFGARAYEIWQMGDQQFPAELESLLKELAQVDEDLNALRTEHVAGIQERAAKKDTVHEHSAKDVVTLDASSESEIDNEPSAEISEENKDSETPAPFLNVPEETVEVQQTEPLSSAIHDLFEEDPRKDAQSQISTALDEMNDSLLSASQKLQEKLDEFTSDNQQRG